MFFGGPDVEAETWILWPPHMKSWLIGKDSESGRDWGQGEKGTTWNGWMASLTWWTWVCVISRSWWWTGRPGVLQFMGSQRVGHDWPTELTDWPTPVFLGFPCGSAGKESTCNAGDLGWIPGLGRSPREGNGYPFQYPGLENSVDCILPAVASSQTQLSDFHSL